MNARRFTAWRHWDQRSQLPQCDEPGVYVLGRFEGSPSENVDPTDDRVLLIAETHRQPLTQRWQQFERSATKGADGHAGGYTFWRLFGEARDTPIPGWLYVAAAAASSGAGDAKADLQRLKNELLARYKERHGILPCCNVRGPIVSEPVKTSRDPVVQFANWLPWNERLRMAGRDAAGVYALAHFDGQPPTVPDVLDQSVIYLGETCDNSLHGRLSQFHRSAFQGKGGHSGGWTYRTQFGDDGRKLYVCAFPVTQLAEPLRSAFIRHVERSLLWQYVRQWGRRPRCNSK